MKLWGGRFKKKSCSLTDKMNSSISIDKRLYEADIKGSIAHVKMLGKCNILGMEDAEKIATELEHILKDINSGSLRIADDAEDIHMFIETVLIKRLGETGKMVHTGRSRNDQVALDSRIYVKDAIKEVVELIKTLALTIIEIAEEHTETLMPGLTHLQKAQPVTFAFHLSAYVEMLLRDASRFIDGYKRVDKMPLGSGALAGTTYPLDRQFVSDQLGFSELTVNAMDAVSDRDFVIEFVSNASMTMMHLSRLSEELILWSTNGFGYIVIDDAYATGSSIMPQKKNPDIAELVRGKTGRVYGDLMALLTIMKALPLAYNKDMQEDKEQLFDAYDTLATCLEIMTPMLSTMKIKKEKMEAALYSGFLNATELADYLVSKGIPFRSAHEMTGELVKFAESKGQPLEKLSIEEMKITAPEIDEDVYVWLNHRNSVNRRNLIGGTSPEAVIGILKSRKDFLLNLLPF